jgi:hypothetical protein
MPTPTEPLKPDDFPFTSRVTKSKARMANPLPAPKTRQWQPISLNASTKTKTGEKKISGQPDYRRLAILADLAPNGSARARRRRL